MGIGGGNRHLFRGLALRFSIGQIQDVGLIFLAGMATFLNICLIRLSLHNWECGRTDMELRVTDGEVRV